MHKSGPERESAMENKKRVMGSSIFGDPAPQQQRYQEYEQPSPQHRPEEQPAQEPTLYFRESPEYVARPPLQSISTPEIFGNSTSALSIPDSGCSTLPSLPDFALPNLPPPEVFDIPKVSNANPNLYHGRRLSPVKSSGFARLRDQLEKDANDFNHGTRVRLMTTLK
jgi:hypothetical protein